MPQMILLPIILLPNLKGQYVKGCQKEQKFLPSHSLAGHNRVRDRTKFLPSSNITSRAPVAIDPKSIQMYFLNHFSYLIKKKVKFVFKSNTLQLHVIWGRHKGDLSSTCLKYCSLIQRGQKPTKMTSALFAIHQKVFKPWKSIAHTGASRFFHQGSTPFPLE